MQHEQIDLGAAGERVDRGRAGVARGRADHGEVRIGGRQEPFEQEAEQLQRDILEGQSRAVEQLEHPLARIELDERGDGGVGEAAIGGVAELAQFVLRQGIADERRQDRDRGLDIGQAGKRPDLVAREARPRLRNVEAAILGEAGERDALEIERGRIPRVLT